MKLAPTLLATAALFTLAGTANATLVSALGGQAVNDTDLNVTWAADAKLAATNTFGLATGVDLGPTSSVNTYGGSYIYSDGSMTWGGAQKWIGAMNTANYLGYNDWRLPTTLQPDASCSIQSGGVSYGFDCTGSEMGHLFYTELGGAAGSSILTTHNANLALFQNVQPDHYWSGTEYAPNPYSAWFYTSLGSQGYYNKSNVQFAWAVRPGQVAAVPVPAAAWLLGSGLLGLIGVARRRLMIR